MSNDSTQIITLSYHDRSVTFDPQARMWNLTAMHTACGGPESKEPRFWLRQQQTQELIVALAERETVIHDHSLASSKVIHDHLWEPSKVIHDHLWETRRGNAGGTWAHWQIAAAYAHYLDPHFYLTWNEWALAYATGIPNAPHPTPADIDALSRQIAQLSAAVAQLRRAHLPAPAARQRPLHPIAEAILDFVVQVGYPVTAAEITRRLRATGVQVSGKYVSVRMRRLSYTGHLVHVAHGVYALPGSTAA